MNFKDLPQDIRDLIGTEENFTGKVRLDALGVTIAAKRDDAVTARKNSGIEDTWMDCEEAYLCIDEENRNEFLNARWAKPTTTNAPLTSSARNNSSNQIRATAYVPMTPRYVDAGRAKVGEILLPVDGKAFSFTASPVPDIIKQVNDKTPIVHPDLGPLMRDAKPDDIKPMAAAVSGAVPQGQPPPDAAPAMVPLTAADLAAEAIEKSEESAKAAEKRIYDWMVESHYPAEMRKVIHDAARIGVGVLKGPFPEKRMERAMVDGTLVIKETVVPAYKWVDAWNFYPDGTCGEDIHKGSHVFEVDYLSPRSVSELKDNPAYLKDRLNEVLNQGPGTKKIPDSDRPAGAKSNKIDDGRFEVWYYYGILSKDDIQSCIDCGAKNLPTGQETVHAIVTLINDTVVRVTINPLMSGKFCYHTMPWRRRAGHWAGVGVGEQIRMAQRMVNAATRAMLVNAAKSAGSQIVVQRGMIEPADSVWALSPDKIWYWSPSATIDDIRKAFFSFTVPSVQKEMMAIIEYAFKLAEESCSIPLISQGQSGKTLPETFGAAQLQDSNANQLLRDIGYGFDDHITEPVVEQSYEWLLLDDDVPDIEKGDFNINAHGSAAMVEKFIQNQAIVNMAPMTTNPAFGIDPKRYAKQLLLAQRLDPRDFCYTKDEQAKIDNQPVPGAPAVQAATIRSQTNMQIAQLREQGETQRSKLDTDRDTVYNQSLAERDRVAAESAAETLKLKREELAQELQLAMLKYANDNKMTLDNVRAGLAKTAMIENTRKELAAAELQVAERQAMFDRTHDKIKHNDQVKIDTTPSLVRDEVSTNVTP